MSVIGIDFGNESCYVATAKSGGIETIANDYSLRATPSCVAFAGNKRVLGVAAKNQMVTNMKCTVSNFKRFLGKKFSDPKIANDIRNSPYRVEERPNGEIGVRVNYLGEDHVFSPEQLTAMLFTKLKESAVTALQAQVNDCVITVPVFATNTQRKALLDAANIAGLNVLRLLNETTATALSYGFYKNDLPALDDTPRYVIFVDFGHASLQVSACAFNNGKLRMLCSTWDEIGGRDFDTILADHIAKEFQGKYKINTKGNARAYLRLTTEIEKLKKQMSANSTKLPLNIECFLNEIDVTANIQRSIMEELCNDLLKRIELTFEKCLKDSKLSVDEIYAVEIVGGSSRIPAVKNLIEKIFKHTVSTTLNQDEAVSRGAALQCAIMSPAVRVRDFSVTDIQNYPVKIHWGGDTAQYGDMEVFSLYHAAPFSRLVTLYKNEPFNVKLYYDPKYFVGVDNLIGDWRIKDVKPNAKGESQEVKIKVRIDQNGIVLISQANIIDKSESLEITDAGDSKHTVTPGATATGTVPTNGETGSAAEQMETDYNQNNNRQEPQTTPTSPTSEQPGGPGWAQRLKGWFSGGSNDDGKKPKKKSTVIELPIEVKSCGYTATELTAYQQQEIKMIINDKEEIERVDARNALEEYVYDMRDKLSVDSGSSLQPYVIDSENTQICQDLNAIESWLYEEGEDCTKDIYRQKLTTLLSKTDPIKARALEYENLPATFIELGHLIQMTCKSIEDFRNKLPKYDHLTETEILNITEAAEKAEAYLSANYSKVKKSLKTQDPPIKCADVRHEIQTLNTCVSSVLNRPKPKPPTPPATTATTTPPTTTTTSDHNQNSTASDESDSQNNNKEEEKMEVE